MDKSLDGEEREVRRPGTVFYLGGEDLNEKRMYDPCRDWGKADAKVNRYDLWEDKTP